MMFKQQMGKLDWFVKDHVTLKTGVMIMKIINDYLFDHRNINYI